MSSIHVSGYEIRSGPKFEIGRSIIQSGELTLIKKLFGYGISCVKYGGVVDDWVQIENTSDSVFIDWDINAVGMLVKELTELRYAAVKWYVRLTTPGCTEKVFRWGDFQPTMNEFHLMKNQDFPQPVIFIWDMSAKPNSATQTRFANRQKRWTSVH